MQVYATKGDTRQLSELSLERLQADVDAWICKHAELALKPLSTPRLHPVEDRPYNLTARDHGDVWWHSVPTPKPQSYPTKARLSKLTEANLEQFQADLRQLDAKKPLRVNTTPAAVPTPDVRGRSHKKAARNLPSSKAVPRSQFLTVGYQRSFSSEVSDRLRLCTKATTSQSSLGDFSSSPTSCGPSTPRDRSCSPCGDALPGMSSPSIAGSDTSSEDFQARPEQLVQKAKEMTVQRKFVHKLKAALSTIRYGYN